MLRRTVPFIGRLAILLILYAGIVAYVYSIQRRLLYFPSHAYLTAHQAMRPAASSDRSLSGYTQPRRRAQRQDADR